MRREKVVLSDFEYCFGREPPVDGWREVVRPYLFLRWEVEQQVGLDEGLGILVEEGDLLRRETREETEVRVRGLVPWRYLDVTIRTTTQSVNVGSVLALQ